MADEFQAIAPKTLNAPTYHTDYNFPFQCVEMPNNVCRVMVDMDWIILDCQGDDLKNTIAFGAVLIDKIMTELYASSMLWA